jgi:hypothetical protein
VNSVREDPKSGKERTKNEGSTENRGARGNVKGVTESDYDCECKQIIVQ